MLSGRRIIYLADFEVPSKSASSIHVMRMCESFANLNNTVMLIALRGKLNQDLKNVFQYYGVKPNFIIKWISLPRIPGRIFLYSLIVFFYVLVRKTDFIYSRSVISAGLLMFFRPGIIELHRPVWEYGKIYNYLFKKVYRKDNLKRIVLISNRLKDIYHKRFVTSKYFVAHDGATFCPPKKDDDFKIQGTEKLKIGYSGGFYKGRGLDILIAVASQMPNYGFHLAGGDNKDLIKFTSSIIPDNIYCYGYLQPSLVHSFLGKMDVLVAPYQQETETIGGTLSANYMSPLKIFEYMAHRKPIVASDLPVLREVLDEFSAILVPPTDIHKWVGAIRYLAESATVSKCLANEAFKKFEENYTWDSRAYKVLNIDL